jgi:hypothetical protein
VDLTSDFDHNCSPSLQTFAYLFFHEKAAIGGYASERTKVYRRSIVAGPGLTRRLSLNSPA